jgi:uncharacterized protein YegL
MRRFSIFRNQRGSVSLTFVLSMVALTTAFVAGYGTMMWSAGQSRLQDALDIATLAGVDDFVNLPVNNPTQAQTDAFNAYIRGYFDANMPYGYLTLNVSSANVTIAVANVPATATTPASRTLTLGVSGSMEVMGGGGGGTSLKVGATSSGLFIDQNNLELALVLDNTGSMADPASNGSSDSKIVALKAAAKTLIDTLVQDSATGSSVNIGLVPTSWLQVMTDASGHTMPATAPFTSASNWSGCVAEPNSGALTDPPQVLNPVNQPFHAYYTYSSSTSKTTHITTYNNFGNSNCIAAPTTFLTSNVTTLENALTPMTANGSTFIAAGIQWGWRMLTPSWRNADTTRGWGSATLPADANSYLTKAIIIITDGENTTSSYNMYSIPNLALASQSGANYVSTANNNVLDNYSVTNSLKPYGNQSTATQDAMEIATCQAAEAQGIKIWAVVFGSDSGTAHSYTVLQQCVNEVAYLAPTDAALINDFADIEGQLMTVRLTK